MNKFGNYITILPLLIFVIVLILLITHTGSHIYTVLLENLPVKSRETVIIDAGHGGIDGGASKNGILESQINLEISLRLNDLMHLLGIKTKMIRTTDCSIYTYGNTVAAQKVSDLKERVRIVNETKDCYLISIHQNYFPDETCEGAQIFYNDLYDSKILAQYMQQQLIDILNPGSNRRAQSSNGIYLMENVKCSAVLIECGFLSNPKEYEQLRNYTYQKNLCCVIVTAFCNHLSDIKNASTTAT